MNKPIIIAFEGIDGSGKGVQLKEAYNRLTKKGYRIGLMDFPVYDSFFGKQIGVFLSGKDDASADKVDVKSMSLWYAMDRWLAFSKFDMSAYDIVLLNRSTLANAVYQSKRCKDKESADLLISWIHELEYNILGIPKPDLFIVFNVSTETSKKNVSLKGHRDYVGDNADVYENNEGFLNDVRNGYINASKLFSNVCLIECATGNEMRPINEIADDIQVKICELLHSN